MKDNFGMPLPGDESPLPWSVHHNGIQASNGEYVIEVGWLNEVEARFIADSVNRIAACRNIVRRLATYSNERQLFVLIEDAEKLWAEMQREAKGGGDE